MEIKKLKCGMWIAWDSKLKTVCQSHKRSDVEMFIRHKGSVATFEMDGRDIGRIKYGRVINW